MNIPSSGGMFFVVSPSGWKVLIVGVRISDAVEVFAFRTTKLTFDCVQVVEPACGILTTIGVVPLVRKSISPKRSVGHAPRIV
jgi:hypothetical protein